MNIGHDQDERNDFDAKLRRVHAQAVERVSPRTFVQLRPHASPRTCNPGGARRLRREAQGRRRRPDGFLS